MHKFIGIISFVLSWYPVQRERQKKRNVVLSTPSTKPLGEFIQPMRLRRMMLRRINSSLRDKSGFVRRT